MPSHKRGADCLMRILPIVRIVTITLLVGWLSAALVAGGLMLLQYQEVVRYFPADQVAAQFQAHLDREVWHGSLLLFVQIGVLSGTLWWQVARNYMLPRYGLLCGVIVALVQAGVGWLMGVPRLFLVPLAVSLVMLGWLAGKFSDNPLQTP